MAGISKSIVKRYHVVLDDYEMEVLIKVMDGLDLETVELDVLATLLDEFKSGVK